MASITKSGLPRKVGSGRRVGSVSFQNTSLGDLKQLFANDNIIIPVSRVWLQNFINLIGSNNNSNAQFGVSSDISSGILIGHGAQVVPIETAPRVQINIRDLNKE